MCICKIIDSSNPLGCSGGTKWFKNSQVHSDGFYRTRVRSLGLLVTNSLTDSLIGSLTDSCLVNLIDVTLAGEDANSKLVEVVSVADVEAENHVGNILLQIWGPRFDHKAKNILS